MASTIASARVSRPSGHRTPSGVSPANIGYVIYGKEVIVPCTALAAMARTGAGEEAAISQADFDEDGIDDVAVGPDFFLADGAGGLTPLERTWFSGDDGSGGAHGFDVQVRVPQFNAAGGDVQAVGVKLLGGGGVRHAAVGAHLADQ